MKSNTINHSRLKEFCDTIIHQAREVLYDREEDILKAWHENIEEAQQNDKKFPPLKLGIGAIVDLEANTIETTLRFTAVYQSSMSADIPDPNQLDLPGVAAGLKMYADAVIANNVDDDPDDSDSDDVIPGQRIVDAEPEMENPEGAEAAY